MSERRVQELRGAVDAVRRLEQAAVSDLDAYIVECLEALLRHAAVATPYYRRALPLAGWRATEALTPGTWQRIPLLERTHLQGQPQQIQAATLPDGCGAARWMHSSGSTGRAIRVLGTAQQATLWSAITLSEHLEHGRDATGRLAAIRVVNGPQGQPPAGSDFADWGEPVAAMHETGPSALLSIDADTRTQARWLSRQDPDYLLTYPSNLAGIMQALEEEGLSLPSLRQVRTISEALGEDTRKRCREQLGVEIADAYSAVEVGYIATQTPDLERYRCRNETLLVEVLDDDGRPAAPGKPGRVVVTALYSYAMPLIRYVTGDVAVAGDRSLWSGAPRYLGHIVGRWRNLMLLPDGSRRWPRLGLRRMNEIAPLRQVQVLQTAIDSMRLRVVCADPLTPVQRDALQRHLVGRFDTITTVTLEQVADIPRGSGGKFEEFRCDL